MLYKNKNNSFKIDKKIFLTDQLLRIFIEYSLEINSIDLELTIVKIKINFFLLIFGNHLKKYDLTLQMTNGLIKKIQSSK